MVHETAKTWFTRHICKALLPTDGEQRPLVWSVANEEAVVCAVRRAAQRPSPPLRTATLRGPGTTPQCLRCSPLGDPPGVGYPCPALCMPSGLATDRRWSSSRIPLAFQHHVKYHAAEPRHTVGAFSHSARTAPIITVIIQVTTLKTTHLRNHAQSIQKSKIQTSHACHGSQGPKFCPL